MIIKPKNKSSQYFLTFGVFYYSFLILKIIVRKLFGSHPKHVPFIYHQEAPFKYKSTTRELKFELISRYHFHYHPQDGSRVHDTVLYRWNALLQVFHLWHSTFSRFKRRVCASACGGRGIKDILHLPAQPHHHCQLFFPSEAEPNCTQLQEARE